MYVARHSGSVTLYFHRFRSSKIFTFKFMLKLKSGCK